MAVFEPLKGKYADLQVDPVELSEPAEVVGAVGA